METTQNISFANILLPLAIVIFIITLGVVLINYHFQKNLFKEKLEQENLKTQHQTRLLQAIIETQENERKRVAKDLHDEIGAALSIIRMHVVQAGTLAKKQDDNPLLNSLFNIQSLSETAISNMRRISHELMPLQLENIGLKKSLENMANHINQSNQITMEVQIKEALPDFSWQTNLNIYRIASELINNTLKYAQASHITLSVKTDANNFFLDYFDDGIGLPPDYNQKGLGQKNIESRIHALGGNMHINSQVSSGVHYQMSIPIQQNML